MKRQGIMARLLDRLQWRPLQVYLRHYRSAEVDISTIAVAYYLILTVFPLIVIAANVFPYLNIDTTDLLNFMSEHLPKQFYAPAANVVKDVFSTPSGQLLGVASLTGFWTMIKSLSSLQKAINKVYGASEHRDVFISHIIGGLLSLVILFLLTFALMLSTIIQSVLRVINQTYPIGSDLTQLILNSIQPLSVAVVFLGVMVLYFILPNVKIRKIRYIMPGTIFTTLVIGYLSNLFGTYVIRTLSRLVDIKLFGSIMIFVFMLWFIFLARILILGAIFNATYQELKQGELHSRRGDVLTIIHSFQEMVMIAQNTKKTRTILRC
ncbi:Ribonuclease BN [Streptococcus sp. HSISS2]|nr:Ribonuclease BN [Streptococcus sp. HSISS2]